MANVNRSKRPDFKSLLRDFFEAKEFHLFNGMPWRKYYNPEVQHCRDTIALLVKIENDSIVVLNTYEYL